MTTPETPRTAAGRAHLDRIAPAPAPDAQELHRRSAAARREATAKAILAIEAEAAAPQPGEHHVHTFPNGEDCECGKTWADARFAPQPFPASQDLDRWASAGGQE